MTLAGLEPRTSCMEVQCLEVFTKYKGKIMVNKCIGKFITVSVVQLARFSESVVGFYGTFHFTRLDSGEQ